MSPACLFTLGRTWFLLYFVLGGRDLYLGQAVHHRLLIVHELLQQFPDPTVQADRNMNSECASVNTNGFTQKRMQYFLRQGSSTRITSGLTHVGTTNRVGRLAKHIVLSALLTQSADDHM